MEHRICYTYHFITIEADKTQIHFEKLKDTFRYSIAEVRSRLPTTSIALHSEPHANAGEPNIYGYWSST